MAMLHFFGGDKGGVGKSLVASAATEYHLDRGLKFSLFDADRSVADVKRTYESVGCGNVIFSEEQKYKDNAFSIYFEAQKNATLVNLPPNIKEPFRAWFEENDLFEVAEKGGVDITYWFVCSGEPASLRLLDEHLSYFQGRVNHVLVKNLLHCHTWSEFEENESLQQKIEEYGVKVVDFPRCAGRSSLDLISKKGVTFGTAREMEELGTVNQQRIKKFLERAYQAFDEVGFFGGDAEKEFDSTAPERVKSFFVEAHKAFDEAGVFTNDVEPVEGEEA